MIKKKNIGAVTGNFILAAVWILPLYWALVTSLKTEKENYAGITLFPHTFTFSNYAALFQLQDGIFWGYMLNSILITVATILIVAVVSVLAGFAFSKLQLFAGKLWMMLILLTLMVPVQAIMTPLYTLMSDLHLLGTLGSMVLIYATFQAPFCVYMMKGSFDMIPGALLEAAIIDGAGSYDILKSIYLPLALPGTITVIVYSAYTTWNDYIVALTFGGSTMKTFNVGLVDLIGSSSSISWGSLTAGSIVSIFPILVLFLFLQKYFIKGMMSGAVK